MTYTSTVTQKGQITLPKALRNKLNIKTREKVIIKLKEDCIEITPTSDILSIAGFLKNKVKVSKNILEAREALENKYDRV